MWTDILSFTNPAFFRANLQKLAGEGKGCPYSPAEADRVRFGLPLANLALFFDELEVSASDFSESKVAEIKERFMLLLIGSLSAREHIKKPVGDIIVAPAELELIANAVRRPFSFSNRLESQVLSETQLGNLIAPFRMRWHLECLRFVRNHEEFMFATELDRTYMRFEGLAFNTNLAATGNPATADQPAKTEFLIDVFTDVQSFYANAISIMRVS